MLLFSSSRAPAVLAIVLLALPWEGTNAIFSRAVFDDDNNQEEIQDNLIEVIPNVFDHSMMATIKQALQEQRVQRKTDNGRYLSNANVGNRVVQSFKSILGIEPFTDMTSLPTLSMTKSTRLHSDSHYVWDSVRGVTEDPLPVGASHRVGFVFLEDNPDAYFNHGDVSIPVKEGSFVHFRGDVPHNTVIHKGGVTLLGPLEMTTNHHVGNGTEPANCDLDELFCFDESQRRDLAIETNRELEPDFDFCVPGFVADATFIANTADGECVEFDSALDSARGKSSKSSKSSSNSDSRIRRLKKNGRRRSSISISSGKGGGGCGLQGDSCDVETDCCYETCLAILATDGPGGKIALTCENDECSCVVSPV